MCAGLLALAGCDDGEPAEDADAGTYVDPGQLVRTGCDASVPLTEVDPAGIWHLDLVFDGASFAVPLRFDALADGGYGALIAGQQVDEVRVSESDIFARVEWLDGDVLRVRALSACRVDDDGSLFGHYASCRDGECSLAVFDAYPIRPLDDQVAAGVSLVGAFAWDQSISANVRVHEGHAYVARFGDGLRILDVREPSAPVEVGHAPVAVADEYYNDVKVVAAGDAVYALVASSHRGVVTIDVTDPANPSDVTYFPLPDAGSNWVTVHTLFVEDTRAYLANLNVGGIDIYDVANPASPRPLGRYVLPEVVAQGAGFVHDLFVSAGRVYLNYWDHGMVIVDALDEPAAPSLVGVFDSYARRTSHSVWVTEVGGRRVAVHGDEDFGAHVRIVDVDEGSGVFLSEIGSYQTRPEVSVHNILAVGALAFVTYYQDGLRVLDLSDPAAPVEVAHYQTWTGVAESNGRSFYEGAIGVDFDNATELIYVVDTHEGLRILSLDN